MQIISFDSSDRRLLERFLQFPYDLYAGDSCFVPPLRGGLKKTLKLSKGMQLEGGPWTLLLADEDGKTLGRLLCGINEVKNLQRGLHEGYVSLFESVNDPKVPAAMLAFAEKWLRDRGANMVTGPVSPTNGDDFRGVIIDGFGRMPAVNTNYTKAYYGELFERCGYTKYLDFYAFDMTTENSAERAQRLLDYGERRLSLKISQFDMGDVRGECRAIQKVFAAAALEQWDHIEIPTFEQIYEEFFALRQFIDKRLIQIARINDEAVGFVAAIPDYNEVLVRMDGRMNLHGILTFLKYRRKIKRIRVFMQFVVPKYQKTAVTGALYASLYLAFKKAGYTDMEGSTIAEFNRDSLASVRGVGFKESRIYRIYQKTL